MTYSEIKIRNNKTLKRSPEYALIWAAFNKLFSCLQLKNLKCFVTDMKNRL